jgi:hypothetical protein
MYSGGAGTTRSDQSCSSFPLHTSCGSRSRFRRSYATWIGVWLSFSISDWYSAVGMFFLEASSCFSASTVFFALPAGFLLIEVHL